MKSHRVIASATAFLLVVVMQGAISAPIPNPKPIEDIYPSQLPDPGNMMIVSGDSGVLQTLIAAGFDLNDTSALSGKSRKH